MHICFSFSPIQYVLLTYNQGLDLDALSRTGRFTFVDGLTGLYSSAQPAARPSVPTARKERVLRSTNVADVKKEVEGAIADLRTSRKVLIIDQLDALLAITDESTTGLALQNLVLSLCSVSSPLTTVGDSHKLISTVACSQHPPHPFCRYTSRRCPGHNVGARTCQPRPLSGPRG